MTISPRLLSLAAASCFLVSCQTTAPKPEIPLTLRTFAPEYADRVLAVTDSNKDGTVTLMEWEVAGGNRRSFEIVDTNRDGRVTRTELLRTANDVRVFDFTRSYADFNKDNKLTPREFRTASGVRVLILDF